MFPPLVLCLLLAPTPRTTVLASYEGGTVTAEEYESWLLANGRQDEPAARAGQLEAVALAESLEAAAIGAGLDRRPETVARLAEIERDQLVAALRRESDRRVTLDAAAVEAELRAEDANRYKPRTIRLRNVFKRVPPGASEAEREVVRARMEDVRRRLVAGEDFDAIAYAESDSQTRFQGGVMGFVPPGVLHPDVDRVAFALKEGEMSPVLASDAGFTILRCDAIAPERVISVDEAREMIRQFRYRQGIEARWEALRLELLGPGPVDEAAFAERAAARARLSGLDRDPGVRARVRWERARWLATQEMARRVNAALAPPAAAEVRAAYEREPGRFTAPAEADVSVIQWRIEQARPSAATFAAAESVRERIRSGALAFEDAARTHSLHPSASSGGRLGFRAPAGLASLGPNAFRVIGEMTPGDVSPLVQQEESLLLLKLWARRPERPLAFDEASARIEKELGDQKVAALRAALEAQARRGLRLVLAP
jgi:parvulin-like peptidyl-prolyl isomerase